MSKFLSALVGVSMLASVTAAGAAEPLTETQMDGVTAGTVVLGPYLLVKITGNLNSITGLNADFETATFFVTAL